MEIYGAEQLFLKFLFYFKTFNIKLLKTELNFATSEFNHSILWIYTKLNFGNKSQTTIINLEVGKFVWE